MTPRQLEEHSIIFCKQDKVRAEIDLLASLLIKLNTIVDKTSTVSLMGMRNQVLKDLTDTTDQYLKTKEWLDEHNPLKNTQE